MPIIYLSNANRRRQFFKYENSNNNEFSPFENEDSKTLYGLKIFMDYHVYLNQSQISKSFIFLFFF